MSNETYWDSIQIIKDPKKKEIAASFVQTDEGAVAGSESPCVRILAPDDYFPYKDNSGHYYIAYIYEPLPVDIVGTVTHTTGGICEPNSILVPQEMAATSTFTIPRGSTQVRVDLQLGTVLVDVTQTPDYKAAYTATLTSVTNGRVCGEPQCIKFNAGTSVIPPEPDPGPAPTPDTPLPGDNPECAPHDCNAHVEWTTNTGGQMARMYRTGPELAISQLMTNNGFHTDVLGNDTTLGPDGGYSYGPDGVTPIGHTASQTLSTTNTLITSASTPCGSDPLYSRGFDVQSLLWINSQPYIDEPFAIGDRGPDNIYSNDRSVTVSGDFSFLLTRLPTAGELNFGNPALAPDGYASIFTIFIQQIVYQARQSVSTSQDIVPDPKTKTINLSLYYYGDGSFSLGFRGTPGTVEFMLSDRDMNNLFFTGSFETKTTMTPTGDPEQGTSETVKKVTLDGYGTWTQSDASVTSDSRLLRDARGPRYDNNDFEMRFEFPCWYVSDTKGSAEVPRALVTYQEPDHCIRIP